MPATLPRHRRTTSTTSITSSIHLSPKTLSAYIIPLIILLGIVIASATQTEVAHYLTSEIGYNQTFFTFYCTHITFSLIFPLHLFVLYVLHPKVPISTHLSSLRQVIAHQLSKNTGVGGRGARLGRTGARPGEEWRDIAYPWFIKVTYLTILVSIPALCWFVAIALTTSLATTTIYASSSFSAYFFSMLLLKQPLSKVTIGSIALAFSGVVLLALDGVKQMPKEDGSGDGQQKPSGPSNPLLGDVVMLIGAILLGLYEVVYKLALPEGHGGVKPHGGNDKDINEYSSLPVYSADLDNDILHQEPTGLETDSPLSPRPDPVMNGGARPQGVKHAETLSSAEAIPLSPTSNSDELRYARGSKLNRQTSTTPLLRVETPPSPHPSDQDVDPSEPLASAISLSNGRPSLQDRNSHEAAHQSFARIDLHHGQRDPVELPAALHANFLTSSIGFVTAILLWIFIPLLHWIGWEPIRWPGEVVGRGGEVWMAVGVISWTGAVYNAGLMILIGVLGPTTSSVANLLTIGLVAVVDAVWVGDVPDLQTMIGVGMICVGFGILMWEGEE